MDQGGAGGRARLTLRDVAAALADGSSDPAGEDARLRAVLSWVDEVRSCPVSERPALWTDPGSSGQANWDALLAGLAEHFAAGQGLATPPWALAESRFLLRWWFLPDTPGARAESIVEAPIALKRRGVFLSERDLVSV